MFVHYLYRVRASDRAAAVTRCEAHLEAGNADLWTPLYAVSFERRERAVLVGRDDWRGRRKHAQGFDDTLEDEPKALRYARELRTAYYFHLLVGSQPLRNIRDTLLREYDEYVTGPDTERTFLAAAEPLFEATLRQTWDDTGVSGPLRDYMKVRANAHANVLANTTAESFPFTLAGADVDYSLCFDLLGEGARYYVVLDVHR